jgi:hypothetical protein
MGLREFKARTDRARAELEAPLKPGESRPVLPIEGYFSLDDWEALWPVIRSFRAAHPDVFNLYYEDALAISFVAEVAYADGVPTMAEVAERMRARADTEGPWLVSTPLANIVLPEPVIQVGPETVVHRAELARSEDDWTEASEAEATDIEFSVYRMLGDRLPRPSRWLFGGHFPERTDTRRGGAIMSVEDGTLALALARTRGKALYAIAIWAALQPPSERQLVPDLGAWVPQPFLHISQRYKEHEHDKWTGGKSPRGGSIYHWTEYEAPGPDLLRLPFEAMEAVRESRSAQALLSSAWALFQASRGSRFQLSERIRHIQVAIETLCESESGADFDIARWNRVLKRHADVESIPRGYAQDEITEAQRRLKPARNVAAHGSDAVLLDLGYPEEAERRLRYATVGGEELAFSGLSADLTPLISVLRRVVQALLVRMRDLAWDDDEFERQFAR